MSKEEYEEIARLRAQIEFMRPKVSLYYILEAQEQSKSLRKSVYTDTTDLPSVDYGRVELVASLKKRDLEIASLKEEVRALREFINGSSSLPIRTLSESSPSAIRSSDQVEAHDLLVEELRRQLAGALAELRSRSRDSCEDTELLRAELDRARTNLLAVEQELREERDTQVASSKRIAVLLRQVSAI